MLNLVLHSCTDSHQWLPIDHWIKCQLFSLVSRGFLQRAQTRFWSLLSSSQSQLRTAVSQQLLLILPCDFGFYLLLPEHLGPQYISTPPPAPCQELSGGLLSYPMQDSFPITRNVYDSHAATLFFLTPNYRLWRFVLFYLCVLCQHVCPQSLEAASDVLDMEI